MCQGGAGRSGRHEYEPNKEDQASASSWRCLASMGFGYDTFKHDGRASRRNICVVKVHTEPRLQVKRPSGFEPIGVDVIQEGKRGRAWWWFIVHELA